VIAQNTDYVLSSADMSAGRSHGRDLVSHGRVLGYRLDSLLYSGLVGPVMDRGIGRPGQRSAHRRAYRLAIRRPTPAMTRRSTNAQLTHGPSS
jgi:hypothetical protein